MILFIGFQTMQLYPQEASNRISQRKIRE